MVVSLYLLFEVLAAVFCLHYLYNQKVKINIITVAFVLAEVMWMQSIYYFELNHNLSLIMYLGLVMYCGVRFGFKFRPIFINNILCAIIVVMLQTTVMIILFALFNVQKIGIKESLVINCTVLFVMLVGVRRCKLAKVSEILQQNEKIMIAVLIAMFLSITFFITNYIFDKGINIEYYLVLIVSLILIGVVVIDIGKHRMKAKEYETELRLHRLYEQPFENIIYDICARQHEFDNHINTIYSQHVLYQTYDELVNAQKQYCKNIVKLNQYNKLLAKGNRTILCFLYGKFSEAEKLGIEVAYKVNMGELECDVPIHKFVELLGNLLNNAIEALESQQECHKLKLMIIENSYEIAINVSNECRNINYSDIQKYFKKGYSEKGENRGYGLYNVKKICEEYNIVLETALEETEGSDWIQFMLAINKPLK